MNPERWNQIKELFDRAQQLSPNERELLLDGACSGDAALREQVEILLKSYESGFLEEPALPAVAEIVGTRSSFEPGKAIGRYRLKELIGAGGMGEVFLADDTELNRPVAFKVLHEEVADDKERVRRFIQEARAASALNHPNILTIYEIGTHENARFIVSEYVDGETLRDRMRGGLTSAESVDIMCQVATALQAAHAAGIVHRDIKPENIMLRQDGLVKVLDFGLAKLTEADDLPIDPASPTLSRLQTSPGLIMGTVAYMSPEQARGQAVDSRTDLWSLGVVFHEMLTGESPFKGESVTDLVSSILKLDSDSLDLSTISQELKPICAKALSKDKKARYQSAQELLHDLQGEKKRMEYATQGTPFVTVSSTDELKTRLIRPRPTLSAEYIVSSVKRHKYATLATVALVLASGIGLSVYKYNGATPPASSHSFAAVDADTTENDLKISKLSSAGRVSDITISPDGRFVAYVTGEPGGRDIHDWSRTSIHVKELATQNDVEIVPPPTQGKFWDLSFTPDDSDLYYYYDAPKIGEIYRVSTKGGSPVKIADDAESGASVSPDGKSIAFNRSQANSGILAIANADGSNERVVIKESGMWCGDVPAWSNDGKSIACGFSFKETDQQYFKLFTVSTVDGSKKPFSNEKWKFIDGRTVWMPDGSLLMGVTDFPSRNANYQIWRVTPTSARAITSDPSGYGSLSATRDGSILVTTQEITRRDLWVMTGNDALTARQITFSGELMGGFSPLADGGVIITSGISNKNIELWRMNLDGSGRKQLTSDQGVNQLPEATRDGRFIIFDSTRGGNSFNVFRMDSDGGNVKQLTENGAKNAGISDDGLWVYYHHVESKERFLYKMSIDGGQSSVVAKVSVDGLMYSISSRDGRIAEYCPSINPMELHIYSADGKQMERIPLPTLARGPIHWTPDGKSVAYDDSRYGQANIWTVSADRKTPPKPLTNFTTPASVHVKWSFDGKLTFVAREFTTNDPIMITNKGN